MPSAIEEAAQTASVDTPAAIATATPAPQPTPAAPTPPAGPSKPAVAPTPSPEPTKPVAPEETPASRASARIKSVLGEDKTAKTAKARLAELPDEEAEKVIKANPASWRVYEAKKKAWAEKEAGFTTKASELEKKIAELSAKPNPTVADDTKLKALEERLAEREKEAIGYKQRLAERDFSESDEYKESFVKPFHASFKKAREFTSAMQVLAVTNEETGEQVSPTRQATPADFDRIFNAPPQQRYELAIKMFGPHMALGVVRRAEDLDGLNEKATDALASHAQNFEKISRERQQAMEGESKAFKQLEDGNRSELEKDWPEHFSVDHYKDQPELQKALADGYENYDKMVASFREQSPEDKASNKVLARAYYAAFPLMHRRVESLKSQVESLTAELAKVRSSDPGAAKPGAVTAPPKDEVGGISAMSAKFTE